MNEKIVVELDQYEYRAVANIINEKRTDMIKNQKDVVFINEILEKVIKAPKKRKSFYKKDRNER